MPTPALAAMPPMPLRQGLPWALLGMVGLGLGVALTVRADLGLGPWDVLHQGMAERTGIGIGIAGILVGVVVLALAYPLGAQIGIVTLVNVVFVGLVIEAALAVLPEVEPVAVRWLLLLAGVASGGLGTSLYLVPRLGAGPRDGLMTALAARGHSVRLVRTAIELSALTAGILLGGTVGIGTVVWAVLVGPVIQQGLGWCTRLVRGREPQMAAAPPPHPG